MSDDFEARLWKKVDEMGYIGPSRMDFAAGYREGRADAERELRKPLPCGHEAVCWIGDKRPFSGEYDPSGYCSACRERADAERELEKTDGLRSSRSVL